MINEKMWKGNELPMKSEKTRTPIKFISLIIWGIQLVLTVLLSISIVKVGVLPTMLLAAVFAVVWIMAAVTGVLTLAGWKKKKSGRTKEIDWKATFRKALDQPQNRVYKQKDTCKPEPERAMSELQERFARYLEKEAPLLLDMPLQPSNEEVGILLKTNKNILRDIVKKINNDKYLTTHKNSVFQTIMELKGKQYGT